MPKNAGGDETRVGRIRARVAATSKFLQRERGRGRRREEATSRRARGARVGTRGCRFDPDPVVVVGGDDEETRLFAALEKLVSATADDAETETRPNANARMDEPVVTVRDA